MSPLSSCDARSLQGAQQERDSVTELEILFRQFGIRAPVAARDPTQERCDEDKAEEMADLVVARQSETRRRDEPVPERERAQDFRQHGAGEIVETTAQDDAGKESKILRVGVQHRR